MANVSSLGRARIGFYMLWNWEVLKAHVINWLCMESALNLRGNQMTRVGAKPILDVMRELNILRLVDMRGNSDKNLLGVLEGGEHYTTFSFFQVGRLYNWLLSLCSSSSSSLLEHHMVVFYRNWD